jgi:hypothetical protein
MMRRLAHGGPWRRSSILHRQGDDWLTKGKGVVRGQKKSLYASGGKQGWPSIKRKPLSFCAREYAKKGRETFDDKHVRGRGSRLETASPEIG